MCMQPVPVVRVYGNEAVNQGNIFKPKPLRMYLWWSFNVPGIYSYARCELPKASQVFVVVSLCDVFRALINSLDC